MILVTGGTGLVGSHLLLDLVKSGEKVRAIYRNERSFRDVKRVFSYEFSEVKAEKLFQQIEWIKADITDVPSLEKAFLDVDFVYHCAAMVTFDDSQDQILRKTNIEGTANVVNQCIKNKIQKLCFVSSIATLDKKPTQSVVSEVSLWNKENDHSTYAITKYGGEMEVWRASQEGVPVVIVNPGVIIGSGFWHSGSGKIFTTIQQGLKYYFPKTTGFVGVKDVVKVMQKLMNSPVKNEQFVVVSENVSFKKIFEMASKSLQKPPPTKKLKPWMIFFGWIWQEISGLCSKEEKQLNMQSKKSLFEDTFYSNEKIKSQLNIEFEPIASVIARTGENFRKDLANSIHLD